MNHNDMRALSREAVELIGGLPSTCTQFDRPEFRGIRVGRQGVWRIMDNSNRKSLIYIKIGLDAGDFAREQSGLAYARTLAENHAWITTPHVLDAQPDRGLIVTKAVEGIRLSDMLADALRIDRNPQRDKRKLKNLFLCLETLCRWMRLFHSLPCRPDSHMICHDQSFSAKRARSNLPRIRLAGKRWEKLSARILNILAETKCNKIVGWGLVHGDLSPGNVLFHGEKICVIDFEDMGYGPMLRDALWFSFLLNRSSLRLFYTGRKKVTEIILPKDYPDDLAAIYNLDFELMRLELACRNRYASKSVVSRFFHLAEIVDCLNNLDRLTKTFTRQSDS